MLSRFRTDLGDVQMRARDDGGTTLVGHAVIYGSKSERMFFGYEIIAKGAATKTLKDKSVDVRSLFNHDVNYVLGRESAGTLRLGEDSTGVEYEIDAPSSQTIRDLVLDPIERGDVREMSFQFATVRSHPQVDGDLEVRVIDELELFEAGPVTVAAYSDTDVSLRDFCASEAELRSLDARVRSGSLTLAGFRALLALEEAPPDGAPAGDPKRSPAMLARRLDLELAET